MTHRSDKEAKLDLLPDVTHRSNKKEAFNLELTKPRKLRGSFWSCRSMMGRIGHTRDDPHTRSVMSPFLELDIGSIRFNRNGTALVQIMGIDREQATIVELTVLQPEHPSSLVLSQEVFEEEPLDYPHQGPHLDTRNPSDEDLGPIFDEEDEPGPVFDEEATRITSIVMESHPCFDPGTIPTPLSPDLQEHCENLDLINSLPDMFVKISSHDVIRFGLNKALITGDLFASSYALNEILIKMLLESKSLRTETDFCDLVLKSDLLSSENDKTWHLLRSFRNICVILNYVEKDMHVLRIIDIVACLDTILVYNVYFDVHLGRLKFSVLSVQERQVQSQRNESIALVHQPEIWSFMNLRNGAVHGYRRDDPMSSQQLDD
ncbi:hypothetical protein F2Q69_00006452 [Brassica cretica]|uniref:Uncharacterized protein n=1 Tax=Brassica cretica TaxID=69181 RepID=A0A8S9PIW0_BRACR|nr:hypothetical protein F2Q69_00006452 [Brassica cretica]